MNPSQRRRRDPVLISAHRCLTREELEEAVHLGVDYVEFDVQRCADGSLVLLHDPVDVAPPGAVTYDEALGLLAGRSRVHLDLKFTDDGVVDATAEAVRRLGTDRLVVTTLDDRSVAAVRAWSDEHAPALLVGLSLGRGVKGFPVLRQLKVRLSELFPHVRYRHSRANVVVAHHTLARFAVARFARRRGLPLLVWTVDTEPSLRYWTRSGRAWLVTTNNPDIALRLRRPDRVWP
jgi:glycerophosphoryl diester phosphodiesterase